MSRKHRQQTIAGTLIVLTITLVVGVLLRQGRTQQADTVEDLPRLFALSYFEGHELAGFTGRPMLLVFGDSRTANWESFLVKCESEASLAELLQTTYQGVFVDAATDRGTLETYGVGDLPTVMIKDLRGPVLGLLVESFTVEEVLKSMQEAAPFLRIEKSPAYERLLRGPDLLDELVEKEVPEEAERLLRLFTRFEGDTPAVREALAHAATISLETQSE